MQASWASLQADVHEKFEKMRAKIEERRAEHDLHVTGRRADRAEAYAFEAVYFAEDAIAEAETAILEAADARAFADAKAGRRGACLSGLRDFRGSSSSFACGGPLSPQIPFKEGYFLPCSALALLAAQ